MGLSGAQTQDLVKAIHDAYGLGMARLDFALLGAGKKLVDYTAQGDVPLATIMRLVREADRENWVEDLYNAVLSDVPVLAELGRELGYTSTPPPPAAAPPVRRSIHVDPLNVLAFDLVPLEQAFQEARGRSSSPLIGVAVPYGEDPFLRFLCERIKVLLGKNTQVQDRLILGGRYGGSSRRLDDLETYRFLMASMNLVCPVPAEDATPEVIDEFWQGVGGRFGDGLTNELVVLFTVVQGAGLPPGITALPAPTFTGEIVGDWTTKVVLGRGWEDSRVAWEWRKFIEERAGTGSGLDVRKVYDFLQVTMSCGTHDELRSRLENWRSSAIAPSG